VDSAAFEFVDSPTLARLQGQWVAVKTVRDGKDLPPAMLATGLRVATKNEVRISFAGQLIAHAPAILILNWECGTESVGEDPGRELEG
jgi:hypothetical protein